MTESEGIMEEKASNSCCAALNKKHTKLLEKYKKIEEIKNQLRDCLDMVSQRYNFIEKENQTLKKESEELKVQVTIWKEEKEKETGICADLKTQVFALKDEIQCMNQNCHSGSQEASHQLREHLNMAEKDIKDLKVLLDEEKAKTALANQKTELERKRADEALRKVGVEVKRASDAQSLANAQRKKMEESKLMLDKLKMDTDSAKSMLALENKKAEKALKEAQLGKKMITEAQMLANLHKEKAEEDRLMLEKLKNEIASVKSMLTIEKSKSEFVVKNAEQEKENALREKERAELATAKAKELKKTAEMNLKSAVFERGRADDLNKKLEEAVTKGLDEKLGKCICFKKSSEAQADGSSNVGVAMRAHNSSGDIPKSDSSASKVTEAHKRMGMKNKKRVDQLSEHVEIYKLRLEELQKEFQERVSFNSPLKCSVISEIDTVKLLKKQLKLEKSLVRHAKKTSKLEALRNNMLHKEVFSTKQECFFLKQRMDFLEKNILNCCEAIPPSVKIGSGSCSRATMYSSGCRSHVFSGTDRLGSNKKMLQPCAINSSSAFFSEPTFMGSQERDTLCFPSLANMGHDISNLKPSMPKFSERKQHDHNKGECHAKSDRSTKSPLKSDKRIGIIATVNSKDTCLEGERLRKCTPEKLMLHGVLGGNQDAPRERNSKKMSCTQIPSKRRKTSSGGQFASQNMKDCEGSKRQYNKYSDHILPSANPGSPLMRTDQCLGDAKTDAFDIHQYPPFDKIATSDYMKLLELDDAIEENAYLRAIAMPLSPSLPQVEFEWDDKLEVDNNENSLESVLAVRDNLPSTPSCHFSDSTPSKVPEKESNYDCSKNINLVMKNDACFRIFHENRWKPQERQNASSSGDLLKYFIVFSDNMNQSSILRILQTVISCTQHCSFLHSTEIFFQHILQALSKDEGFSSREKVCAFFSMFLHAMDEVGWKNFANASSDDLIQSLDLVSAKIHSAFTDPVLRRMFMECFDFLEFYGIIEDFILHRKLLVYDRVLPEFEDPSIPKTNFFLNNDAFTLYEVMASSYLLVSSANLLATLCSEVDQIGFICEFSCNILTRLKSDPAVLLPILHVFARVCGSRLFTFQQYSLSMTVVKSITIVLEKQPLSITSTVENPSENWCCRENCPFSVNRISMEDVALLLLENFRNHVKLENEKTVSAIDPSEKDKEFPEATNTDFLDLVDIISLMEIVASYMDWNWTYCHIVVRLCEYLDSHPSSKHSAIAIVLLGQLGRIGIDAYGYEDNKVKELQNRLSTFVNETSFKKLCLFHQFATVNSWLGLTTFKFDDVVEDRFDDTSACKLITQWFFHLNKDQQALFKLHHTSGNLSPVTTNTGCTVSVI